MTREPSLVVAVVLNWKSWEDCIRCITSLRRSSYHPVSVIVCDADSNDGSLTHLAHWAHASCQRQDASPEGHLTTYACPNAHTKPRVWSGAVDEFMATPVEQITDYNLYLVALASNMGYARGNNVGLSLAKKIGAESILIVNPDTTVHPYLIETLEEESRRLRDQPAVLGPKILSIEGIEDWQRPTRSRLSARSWIAKSMLFPLLKRGWCRRLCDIIWHFGEESAWVGVLQGSLLFARTDVWELVHGFDPDTFLYTEEERLALRLALAGGGMRYVPGALAWHNWGRRHTTHWRHLIGAHIGYFRDVLRLGPLAMAGIRIVLSSIVLAGTVGRKGHALSPLQLVREVWRA